MKTLTILVAVAILLGIASLAFAQEFPDVPPDHWAYDAVQNLVSAGIIVGYPDGTFGGKRALTRYEFAEAIARAIPAILAQVPGGGGGEKGEKGDTGPAGPQGPPGVGAEQLAALQKLVDEFRDELAALGVDVEALRRDVAALSERVAALEAEQARVRFSGEGNMIGFGEVVNNAAVFDKDSRLLGLQNPADINNPIANSRFLNDFALRVQGRVSDNLAVKADFVTGNYLPFALLGGVDDFTLWNMYLDGGMKLGFLGEGQVLAGRFPFQVTPLTFKFVDPDSYTYVTRLDSGNFILDGAAVTLGFGKVGLTAFAGKTDDQVADLISPDLAVAGVGEIAINQVAGARAVIGTSMNGNLGLTYMQAGAAPGLGRMTVMGADLNATFSSIGVAAEYAQSSPSDTFTGSAATAAILDDNNTAWNAKLGFQAGSLGINAGYSTVESNYAAPGYWSRLGRAVNLTNVKGFMADLSYSLGSNLSLVAEGQFLEPDEGTSVNLRQATVQASSATAGALDKITYWRAGVKYALTAANSVDLGWEQVNWEPVAGADTEERYISIGVGHSINPNASLKLLYQIIEFEQGGITPYGVADSYRGGKAAAQFQVKF